jgi:hypothetical protein
VEKLHNEELNDIYSSPNIIRVIKSRRRDAYRVLVVKPEGKRSLGRPRRRWEDNIKLQRSGMGEGAWTGLIWYRIGTGGGLL